MLFHALSDYFDKEAVSHKDPVSRSSTTSSAAWLRPRGTLEPDVMANGDMSKKPSKMLARANSGHPSHHNARPNHSGYRVAVVEADEDLL
jgi:hypothetical protein